MLNLRDKIAQMLILGFSGQSLDDMHEMAAVLKKYTVGGVILFDQDYYSRHSNKNLNTQQQTKALIAQLQSCNHRSSLPLFIGIDYEGGKVDRLKQITGVAPTLSAAEQANLADKDLLSHYQQMADVLQDLGFNLNFAPVVDLALEKKQGVIAALDRCFSDDPVTVSRLARQFVDIFNQRNIICTYKHFPGHGSATGDTHQGFVDTTETFKPYELFPYQDLINENQDALFMIMSAHVINRQLDPTGLPATLSHEMLSYLLREQMGFGGIIVSDDMQMKALADNYDLKEALRLALQAGVDLFIFANQLGQIDAETLIHTIEELVLSKIIPEARIQQACQRIAAVKQRILV